MNAPSHTLLPERRAKGARCWAGTTSDAGRWRAADCSSGGGCWGGAANPGGGGAAPAIAAPETCRRGGCSYARRIVHGVVQFLGLVLQEQWVERGVAGDGAERVSQHAVDVPRLLQSASRAGQQLLLLLHLLTKLVLQGGNLSTSTEIHGSSLYRTWTQARKYMVKGTGKQEHKYWKIWKHWFSQTLSASQLGQANITDMSRFESFRLITFTTASTKCSWLVSD